MGFASFSVFTDQPLASKSAKTLSKPRYTRMLACEASAPALKMSNAVGYASRNPSNSAIPVFRDTFVNNDDDKENIGGLRRKSKSCKSSSYATKSTHMKASGSHNKIAQTGDRCILNASKMPNVVKSPRLFEDASDNKPLSSSYQSELPDIWAGRRPFEIASPENEYRKAANAKFESIYDMQGVKASLPSREPPPQFPVPRCDYRKANKPKPKRKRECLAIYRDPLPSFLSNSQANENVSTPKCNRRSGLDDARDAAAIERRMRDLTESPLADVTEAYTGKGTFVQASTSVSCYPHKVSGLLSSCM